MITKCGRAIIPVKYWITELKFRQYSLRNVSILLNRKQLFGNRKYSTAVVDNRTNIKLYHEIYFENKDNAKLEPLVICHGLFGSHKNWRSLCKSINRISGRQVIAFDAINHGSSSHHAQMSYSNMATDVKNLLDLMEIEKAIVVGHSMGGKTAMCTALSHSSRVSKLVVVDAAPTLSKSMGEVKNYLDKMISMDLSKFKSRKEVENELKTVAKSPSICTFLMANLHKTNTEEFRWKINLNGILDNYYDHIHTFPSFNSHLKYNGPTLFIGGGRSYYITELEYPEIYARFPSADIHHIPDAGHWVHAEKPKEFLDALLKFVMK